jgi:hypothetical protein
MWYPVPVTSELQQKSSAPAPPPVDRSASTRSFGRTLVTRPLALLLVLLMAVGSVAMWIGIPIGWVWVASRTVKTSQPSLGPYLLVLFAVPISMWICGKLLYRLNAVYSRVTGESHEVRAQLPWHKSMRGERHTSKPTTVLELVMIISVSVALTAFAVWFFGFAGSSIPNL